MIETESLCPTCYRIVPAYIDVGEKGVKMEKYCEVHGTTSAVIESDPDMYAWLRSMARVPTDAFPETVMLDVTARCNMKCAFCYYPLGDYHEPTVNALVDECKVTTKRPVLTGGEPTVREDLPEIIKALKAVAGCTNVAVLTNGIKLADPDYLDKLVPVLTDANGFMDIGMSFHSVNYHSPALRTMKEQALKLIKERGLKIFSMFFTITSLSDLPGVLANMRHYRDMVQQFRIRWPFNAWNEAKAPQTLFLSQILNELLELAKNERVQFVTAGAEADNNPYHYTGTYDGMNVRLVACPNVNTVDLRQLRPYGPRQRALNGELVNFIHALIINEGIQKGWLYGRRINQLNPLSK
jgi:uncharacterized Fe-S cluster-containing radical SAM superfamily protein